jgi:hypothetical protein
MQTLKMETEARRPMTESAARQPQPISKLQIIIIIKVKIKKKEKTAFCRYDYIKRFTRNQPMKSTDN